MVVDCNKRKHIKSRQNQKDNVLTQLLIDSNNKETQNTFQTSRIKKIVNFGVGNTQK